MILSLRATLLLAAAVAAPAAAQPPRTFATHVDDALGFTIKVPKFCERVPIKDFDEQTVARFYGTYEVDLGRKGKEQRPVVMVLVRIDKLADPTTGGGPQEPADAGSIAAARARAANRARTLEDYLKLRGVRLVGFGTATEANGLLGEAGLESKEGLAYQEYAGDGIRAFVTETDAEIFGLVAMGSILELDRHILRTIRSLERGTSNRYVADDGDPYADLDLPDLARRRQVRSRLIEGWEAHDTENFILVTNVRSSLVVKRMLQDLETMRAAYLERFPPCSPEALDVVSTVRVCDGYDDYLKYAGSRLRGTGGYWAFADEELVLFNPERRVPKLSAWLARVDPIAVLYHEAMHQYLHYANGEIPPAPWFGEGFGEVFGGAVVNRTKGEITRIDENESRLGVVRLARKSKQWPELEPLLKMDQKAFYSQKPLENYAFAWAFCYFLELEGRKRPDRRNEAWAALPREYLRHLREAADELRRQRPESVVAKGGESAGKLWLLSQAVAIQARAHARAFAAIDLGALQAAWIDAMKGW